MGGVIARFTSIRSPPVWILATIFGTFPSWCTAWRVSADETPATPSSFAISFACASVNVSCVPGQEEVVHEVRAGLAELREVGDHRSVCLDDVSAAARPERAAADVLLGGARDGQVRADRGQRVERRALRLVESFGEARDRDHQADADGEAQQRQDRAAAAAEELGAEVPEIEHTPIEPRPSKTRLRIRSSSR